MAPATASQVLSYAAVVAGFVVSWGTLAADYTIYMPSSVPKVKVFIYAYFGFFLPLCLLEILGAAFVNTSFVNEAWAAGYATNGVGGLLAAVLEPAGRFGKFCMVVLAMSTSSLFLLHSSTLSLSLLQVFQRHVPRQCTRSGLASNALHPSLHTCRVGYSRLQRRLCKFSVFAWKISFGD